ncbi:MAG: hydroxypyruvate isomerase, partial [Verrucomicrobiae bacterium]|nr:hydroxypyruvate isomerase [Verrucomicrobiae bacterium]
MSNSIPRRTALKTMATGAAAVAASQALTNSASAKSHMSDLKGNINHAVCKWCYKDIELDPFCKASKDMGISGIDLLGVNDFPTLQKYGLVCSMVSGVPGGIRSGLNRVENHENIIAF